MQNYILLEKLLLAHTWGIKIFTFQFFFIHFSDQDDSPEFTYIEDVKGYTIAKRGSIVLVDQKNHTYLKKCARKSGKVYWNCTNYRKFNCKATLVTKQNKIIKIYGEHDHLVAEMNYEFFTTPK